MRLLLWFSQAKACFADKDHILTTDGYDQATGSTDDAFLEKRGRWPRIKRILEQKIVPSLVIETQSVLQPTDRWHQDDGASDALVALALQGREDQAREEIRQLAEQGMSFERLQLGLLARAAQKIGVLWEEDNLSFVDTTLAVGTIQRLMHFIALDLSKEPLFGMTPKSICLFPEPGATHILGVSMAARFFQHAGWQVDFLPDPSESAITRILKNRHIDVIGVSLNRTDSVKECSQIVRRLVKSSMNRKIVTIGGGSALSRDPDLIGDFDVDAVLAAIEFAPKQASRLVKERS